jgi:hypothetical protein
MSDTHQGTTTELERLLAALGVSPEDVRLAVQVLANTARQGMAVVGKTAPGPGLPTAGRVHELAGRVHELEKRLESLEVVLKDVGNKLGHLLASNSGKG